ncbi:cysteine-rich CWC family protein [Acidovorax sp. MR-S7]|uniref:cysteine-rich CWC family protein n=1 Tax=Acidovorax sp. MR-S7 TaxID=1268622 RepID=UPI0035104AA6
MTAGLPAGECWCMAQPVSRAALARVPPDQRGRACLCPRCAADMIPDPHPQEPPCPPTTSK